MSAPDEKCGNGHSIAEVGRTSARGRCRACQRINRNRAAALRNNRPLCPEGHGLVGRSVNEDGSCAECSPPLSDTWLDWAAVYRAIEGAKLFRPLTKYETVCAVATVCRRNQWGLDLTASWLRANTGIAIPADDALYLMFRWAPEHGLPLLTVSEAITYGIDYDDVYDEFADFEEIEEAA